MEKSMTWLLVFVGGGIGSLMRFGLSKANFLKFENFPLATLLTNILASVFLGLFVWLSLKFGKNECYWSFFAVGICGGFSTFSTFSMENVELIQGGNYLYAIVNITASLLLTGLTFFLIVKLP
ncbi:MAG: CrcB family protein [Bacteroidetes bacterium]|nr:CrcB family protein [Bacteroidota bacterium]